MPNTMYEARSTGRVRDRRRKLAAREKYLDSFNDGSESNDYEKDDDDEFEEQTVKSQKVPHPTTRSQPQKKTSSTACPWIRRPMAFSESLDNSNRKRSLGTADGVSQPTWDSDDELVLPTTKEARSKKKSLISDILVITCDGDSLNTNAQRLEDQGYEVVVYTLNKFPELARAGKAFNVQQQCAHDGLADLKEELAIVEEESSGAWTPSERIELVGVVAAAISISETLKDYTSSQAVIVASEHGGEAAQLLVSLVNIALGKLRVRGLIDARSKPPVSKWSKVFLSKMRRMSLTSMLFAAKEFFREI